MEHVTDRQPFRIYLLGFMGSGKSTLGRKMAHVLQIPFLDLDHQIVAATGMSVPEIFAQHGEAYFRQIESQQLKETIHIQEGIISLGGGTPCFFDHMEWVNQHGLSIFLDVSVPVLVKRLSKNPQKRPLISQVKDLSGFVAQKLESRRAFYEQAHLIYHINQMDVDAEFLGRYLSHFLR